MHEKPSDNASHGLFGQGTSILFFMGERSYPPMTGGWAVVGVSAVGFNGHSVRCLVRLLICWGDLFDSVSYEIIECVPWSSELENCPYRI